MSCGCTWCRRSSARGSGCSKASATLTLEQLDAGGTDLVTHLSYRAVR
jgi:hypothetical protein